MIQELHMAGVMTSADWWYDSGATAHICNKRAMFKDYTESTEGHEVLLGDHRTIKVLGSGTVELFFTSGKKVVLTNVLHVPDVRKNLVSGFMLCKKGIKVVIESDRVILTKAGMFVGKGYVSDGMFKLSIDNGNINNKVDGSAYIDAMQSKSRF
ncbi:unnamed protein product [Linum trigynum]|uniref:Retrovirus-related Pol polyprotein from transposon TNT 1-94-like beta-barrel domain-containing protein n=1 Tax=Linum trigynum TaxID=586398 RepID=A0AAV2GVJ5_9ROSI